MEIEETASGAKYRMDKLFQNFPNFGISIVFRIEKNQKIC